MGGLGGWLAEGRIDNVTFHSPFGNLIIMKPLGESGLEKTERESTWSDIARR